MKRIYRTAITCVAAATGIFLVMVGLFSAAYTIQQPTWGLLSIVKDSWIRNLLFLPILTALCIGGGYLAERIGRRRFPALIVTVVAALWILGIVMISQMGSYPMSDQAQIYVTACSLYEGDAQAIIANPYIEALPYQLRLAWFFSLWMKLFRNEAYALLQTVGLTAAVFTLYAGYRVTDRMTESAFADGIYLALSLLCLPLYFYGFSVYGDVWGAFAAVISIWLYLEYRKTDKLSVKILCVLLMAFMLWLLWLVRIALAVVWIAMLLLAIAESVLERKAFYAVGVGGAMLLTTVGAFLTDARLERMTGVDLAGGTPTVLATLAMGMQGELEITGDADPGFYNAYNVNVYYDNGNDTETASEAARAYISGRLEQWRGNVGEMLLFYKNKTLLQWIEPTYGVFTSSAYMDEPAQWIENIWYKQINSALRYELDGFQVFYYLILAGMMFLVAFRRRDYVYDLFIAVMFGEILFSLLWESKGRYLYPYAVICLPLAASAIKQYQEKGIAVFKRHFHKVTKGETQP